MKTSWLLGLVFFFSTPVFADSIDDHEQYFRNYSLCDLDNSEQVKADTSFKDLFATLKMDEDSGQYSGVEYEESAYSTILKNNDSGLSC